MTVASTAVWVLAYIAAAYRAMRQPRLADKLRPDAQAALAMLLVFSTLAVLLAAIQIETRLMLPAFPAGLLVAVYALRPNG
jgi:Kef-type K+ transport system membrane component KefB